MDQNYNTPPTEEQSNTTQQSNTSEAQQFPYTPQNDSAYFNTVQPPKAEPNGYAIASLILGIVSLVLCCCSCVSIVTSILAIVFAILSRQGQPMRGNALGGMICGIVSLVATVLVTGCLLLSIAETNYEDLDDFLNDYMNDGYSEENVYSEYGNGNYYIIE